MPIRTRNKISATFSMASMSDLVFLLLIFFMITSTLVAPNLVKLLISDRNTKVINQQTVSVYINSQQNFFVDGIQVSKDMLQTQIAQKLLGQTKGTVVLKADKSVTVLDMVTVMDAVNEINQKNGTDHKVILATLSK